MLSYPSSVELRGRIPVQTNGRAIDIYYTSTKGHSSSGQYLSLQILLVGTRADRLMISKIKQVTIIGSR